VYMFIYPTGWLDGSYEAVASTSPHNGDRPVHVKLSALTALLTLSLSASNPPRAASLAQDQPLCGVCLELDNETLPDKHYFPPPQNLTQANAAPLAEHTLGISAQVWASASLHASHSGHNARGEERAHGPAHASGGKHGSPSTVAADHEDADWAWGGVRECSAGPEGKISAGCHTAPYDNLLCNSHYNDCDDELFALAESAVNAGDAPALLRLMQQPGPAVVVLNKSRSAIQLVGCSGAIVGNFPLHAPLLRALQ
jgi:hypothetical protein